MDTNVRAYRVPKCHLPFPDPYHGYRPVGNDRQGAWDLRLAITAPQHE